MEWDVDTSCLLRGLRGNDRVYNYGCYGALRNSHVAPVIAKQTP